MALFAGGAALLFRRVQVARAALFGAAFLAALNPRMLVSDVGFQLSFFAVFGMAAHYPLLKKLLPWRIPLLRAFLLTFSATLWTAPLAAYRFGYFSPVGIFANLLAIPVFSLAMAAGIAFVISAGIPVLKGIAAFGASAAAEVYLRMVETASSFSWAGVNIGWMDHDRTAIAYIVLFASSLLSKGVRTQFFPCGGEHGEKH